MTRPATPTRSASAASSASSVAGPLPATVSVASGSSTSDSIAVATPLRGSIRPTDSSRQLHGRGGRGSTKSSATPDGSTAVRGSGGPCRRSVSETNTYVAAAAKSTRVGIRTTRSAIRPSRGRPAHSRSQASPGGW